MRLEVLLKPLSDKGAEKGTTGAVPLGEAIFSGIDQLYKIIAALRNPLTDNKKLLAVRCLYAAGWRLFTLTWVAAG